MRVQINMQHLSGVEPSFEEPKPIYLECGLGDQVVKWAAFAACYRLANNLGEPITKFVPHAIVLRGKSLDINVVIRSVVGDGESLTVQYGEGPLAFSESPNSKQILSAGQLQKLREDPNDFIKKMDLDALGFASLLDEDVLSMKDEHFLESEIEKLKGMLLKHGGSLLAGFFYLNCGEESNEMSIDRMSLSVFKEAILNTGIVNEYFPHGKLNAIFDKITSVKHSDTKIELRDLSADDFLATWVQLAGEKYQPGLQHQTWGYFELTQRFQHLLDDFVNPKIIEKIGKKVSSFKKAFKHEIDDLLSRARRYIQMAMYSMQEKRTFHERQVLQVNSFIKSLVAWDYAPEDLSLTDIVTSTLYAKNFPETDPMQWHTVPQPLDLNLQELEICLTVLGFALYQKTDKEEDFPSYLSEFLDDIFHYAGVIVEGSDSEEEGVIEEALRSEGSLGAEGSAGGRGEDIEEEEDEEED